MTEPVLNTGTHTWSGTTVNQAPFSTTPEGLAQAEYQRATPLTPGTPVDGARGIVINATVAGVVRLKLADGSTVDWTVSVGSTVLRDWSVVDVVAGSTTATATYTLVR